MSLFKDNIVYYLRQHLKSLVCKVRNTRERRLEEMRVYSGPV
jgi:hypothetical protein